MKKVSFIIFFLFIKSSLIAQDFNLINSNELFDPILKLNQILQNVLQNAIKNLSNSEIFKQKLKSKFDQTIKEFTMPQVRNAFIRLVDDSTGVEIAKYDLSEDYSSAISVIMGELYRHNGDWKFNAMGQGRTEDLSALCSIYGL